MACFARCDWRARSSCATAATAHQAQTADRQIRLRLEGLSRRICCQCFKCKRRAASQAAPAFRPARGRAEAHRGLRGRPTFSSLLEVHPEPQLDIARTYFGRPADPPETAARQGCIGPAGLRVIKGVEELGPELAPQPLPVAKALHHGNVGIACAAEAQ